MGEQITEAITEPTKRCCHCKENKGLSEFCRNKSRKDGLNHRCKSCVKEYEAEHKEEKKLCNHRCHLANKDEINARKKQRHLEHPEESKLSKKKSRLKNKDKIRISNNIYQKNRRKTDINFAVISYCRSIVRNALNSTPKYEHTMAYFMCSNKEFREHIEKQFESWMNWKNHGNGVGKWNIDHIIPISFFNILDPTELYMCCRYQNLRPISWEKNRAKSDKIVYHKNNASELC